MNSSKLHPQEIFIPKQNWGPPPQIQQMEGQRVKLAKSGLEETHIFNPTLYREGSLSQGPTFEQVIRF